MLGQHAVKAADDTFRSLYDSQYAYVLSSARRLGVPQRDLDDTVHDVFVIAHKLLPTTDLERPMRPWLFAIAARVVSQYRRRAHHRNELLVESDAPSVHPDAERILEARDRRRILERALDAINDERRPVFVLHELDEVAVPDVAKALDLPLNTAYSRLRLAREEFSSAVRRISMQQGGVR